MHFARYALILCVLIPLACGGNDPSSPPAGGTDVARRVYPERGVFHSGSILEWDAAVIADAARGSVFITPMTFCFAPEAAGIVAELRRLNPRIRILGYQLVMGIELLWSDTSLVDTPPWYGNELYDSVEVDWAYTTTGDTLMIWPDLIFLNPIRAGGINRPLIDTIVGLIEKYREISGGGVDGIMHDYFMDAPYINPHVRDRVEGEIDFDGDGVVFDDDPDERELFVAFQKEYAREIRGRFGPDFIQIGNGHLPQVDGELAAILNGIFYEEFPNNRMGMTDRDGLLRLLRNQTAGYLTEAQGRTWSIVTNEYGGGNNLFCLVASMLADCLYTEFQGLILFTGWTLEVRGGEPLGSALTEGSPDSLLTVRRAFTLGEARISFDPAGRRSEVAFERRAMPR